MTRSYLPLNSLRAFEAAARHLSFRIDAIVVRGKLKIDMRITATEIIQL